MASKWFLDVFLPSVIEKMENNKKYPNSMILSDKQVEVCERNMEHKEARTCYGWSGYREIAIDGYVVTMQQRGRYTFLYVHRVPTKRQLLDAKVIMEKIESEDKWLDLLYDLKDKSGENADNEEAIKDSENRINTLWQQYNEVLKV